MKRALPLVVLILFIGLLQGCSAVQLGYGHADTLARWWISKYIDLSFDQDAFARERLDRLLAWHRRVELPEYAVVLKDGQKFVDGQPTVDDVLRLADDMVRRAMALAEQAAPDVADLLLTLTPAQIDAMGEHMAHQNEEFGKDEQLADGASGQRNARYKDVLEHAEYWFGDFSGEQKTALRHLIAGQIIGSQFWYDERLRRQREWLDLARLVQRERPQRERTIRMIHDYAQRFYMPVDLARLGMAQSLRRASAELAIGIHQLVTTEQRTLAHNKLSELILSFEKIALDSR